MSGPFNIEKWLLSSRCPSRTPAQRQTSDGGLHGFISAHFIAKIESWPHFHAQIPYAEHDGATRNPSFSFRSFENKKEQVIMGQKKNK